MNFDDWRNELKVSGATVPIRLGMDRGTLKELFGEPHATAAGFRKQPLSGIMKYGDIEFHFDGSGSLFLVYSDDQENPTTYLFEPSKD